VEDKAHCSLVIGKSRVAPLKQITVPRLELAAATVSANTSKFLRQELSYTDIKENFWTDSKIVLGYVNNEAKRFHVYVANRIQQIRDVLAVMLLGCMSVLTLTLQTMLHVAFQHHNCFKEAIG